MAGLEAARTAGQPPGRWVKSLQGERLQTHRVVRAFCVPGGGIWNKPMIGVSFTRLKGVTSIWL